MNTTPRLSVALVTRNRPQSLARCLESWSRQTVQPYEIVVSDDSNEQHAPQTAHVVAEYGCRYIHGPQRGLYANRNHASVACRGTHVISADDDHTHPIDYAAAVLELIVSDPHRVWVLTERDPAEPQAALTCPPELHRSGMGCSPADSSRCAAIADGSTVYPRGVFDSGLRYDERYPFGGLWYLWGKLLARRGWRISFSDRTFVWHHFRADALLADEGRLHDPARLRQQLLAMTYVQFVNALWVEASPVLLAWATAYLLRRVIVRDSIIGYHVRTTIPLTEASRAAWWAWRARGQYQS